jgi:hypothetical protein
MDWSLLYYFHDIMTEGGFDQAKLREEIGQ